MLGGRHHRGVRGAQREVRVRPHEVGHPGEVLRGGGLDCGACLDRGACLDLEEVGDLGDDRGWDDAGIIATPTLGELIETTELLATQPIRQAGRLRSRPT